MKNDFKNLFVLITRPKHQAGGLIDLIKNKGGDYFLLPTIDILPADNFDAQVFLKSLQHADFAIFLSANAVPIVGDIWPGNLKAKVIAIGPGTKAALNEKGIQVDSIPQHYCSEGILELEALKNAANKNFVIFCGQNPRPLLKQTLIKNNLITEIVCYQRQKPSYQLEQIMPNIRAKNINAIVSTSLESLQNCYEIFTAKKAWVLSKPLIVISKKMVTLAKELGFKGPVILADNASLQSLENALIELAKIEYNSETK